MYRIISQRSTLIVAAPDTSYFVLLFQKQGNAAKRRWFEVCKTSKLHSTRRVLPRQGQTSCLSGSSRKGTSLFFSLLRKEPKVAEGPRPSRLPGTVQNSIDYIFSWHFRLSSLNRHMVRPTFSDVLNRCERVTVVQTQDRYFSKMGYHTASLQGQVAFKKGSCSLSLLQWEFVFAVCWLNV